MTQFRKKPVVIDAWQVPPSSDAEAFGHFAMSLQLAAPEAAWHVADSAGVVAIQTLEGVMTAQVGDWVIRGVKGEIYPCKPDIFAATYEPA